MERISFRYSMTPGPGERHVQARVVESALEIDGTPGIEPYIEAFRAFLVGVGFHPDTIEDRLGQE